MACFSCGKRVAHLWTAYRAAVERGVHPNEACAALGLARGCCKRMLMTHTDEIAFRVMFASDPRPEFRSEARTARTHPPRRQTSLPVRARPAWRAAPAAAAAVDDAPAAPAAPAPGAPGAPGLGGGAGGGAGGGGGGAEDGWAEVRPPWAADSWTPVAAKCRA